MIYEETNVNPWIIRDQRAENARIVRLMKGTLVIIGNRIHDKMYYEREYGRYRRGRNTNPTTSAIGNLIFLPTRKLNTAGLLLSYNQVVSSSEDERVMAGWDVGKAKSGKEEGKVEFIGLAFISSSKCNRILVRTETAESRST